jgi:hypothetical protein
LKKFHAQGPCQNWLKQEQNWWSRRYFSWRYQKYWKLFIGFSWDRCADNFDKCGSKDETKLWPIRERPTIILFWGWVISWAGRKNYQCIYPLNWYNSCDGRKTTDTSQYYIHRTKLTYGTMNWPILVLQHSHIIRKLFINYLFFYS